MSKQPSPLPRAEVDDCGQSFHIPEYSSESLRCLRLKGHLGDHIDDQAAADLADAFDEITRLGKALEHYAEARNWSSAIGRYPVQCVYASRTLNGYDVARAALGEEIPRE